MILINKSWTQRASFLKISISSSVRLSEHFRSVFVPLSIKQKKHNGALHYYGINRNIFIQEFLNHTSKQHEIKDVSNSHFGKSLHSFLCCRRRYYFLSGHNFTCIWVIHVSFTIILPFHKYHLKDI